MSIYKDCDIRGKFGPELTAGDGYLAGRALATVTEGGCFCVGGDVRVSTPALKEQLIKGLLEGGSHVIDLGRIPTPVMYYAMAHLPVDGGVMVTASHNPAEYNGIKFMLGAEPVTREEMNRVRDIALSRAFRAGEGTLEAHGTILEEYAFSLEARFGAGKKPFKIVLDAGNGAMSLIAPQAARRCGYEAVELFCEPDGRFPNRTPNPAEYDKLTALAAKVRETGADYGVAFDGDGDRAVFADEKGEIIKSERTLALFVRYLLKDHPTSVVYDQKSSSVVWQEVLRMGGTPVPERSGHTFIKRRFLNLGAAVAGEVSGHFFLGELGYDDALFAALLLGEALGKWGVKLSEALSGIVCPPITPDIRVSCPYGEQEGVLRAVENAFPGARVSHMDGVRVELQGGWLLVRKSVTAEQVTVRAEGESEERLSEILAQVRAAHPRLAQI